jgi:molecular chaperone Hsp33
MKNLAKDEVGRWFICDGRVLISVAKTTNLVNSVSKLHGLTPTTSATLGRALTMSAIMGSKLKNKTDNITSIFDGGGGAGKVVTVAKFGGSVKGFVDYPKFDCMPNEKGKIDVAKAVGKNGKLKVISDLGFGKPYEGEVNLVSGEIAEDYARYYAFSLQQPCAVGLGVLVSPKNIVLSAGGFLIEVMPNANEDDLKICENISSKLTDISRVLQTLSIREFIDKYCGELKPELIEIIEPKLKCDCSIIKVKKTLKAMGEKELYDILNKQGKIEVTCGFCGKVRTFNKCDIDKLLNK